MTDITYIRTWQGWLYLAVVIDLHSRRVVGWSMQPTLRKEIVLDALLMAVRRRRPRGEVIVHSDQGSQYTSDDWNRFCKAHGLVPSMSRRGNCWDNAVAESFFGSLKKERVKDRVYKTRDIARADLFEYIEVFYNQKRRHRHLGGVSPACFEQEREFALEAVHRTGGLPLQIALGLDWRFVVESPRPHRLIEDAPSGVFAVRPSQPDGSPSF